MIGLVVNPVAGVGGPAGLAGSDGADVQRLALARGARSRVQERTAAALAVLADRHPALVVVTAAGAMGADAVHSAGLVPCVVYEAGPTASSARDVVECTGSSRREPVHPAASRALGDEPGDMDALGAAHAVATAAHPEQRTDAADTSRAVAAVATAGADLILVVGGDGTLRDAVTGLGDPASALRMSAQNTDVGRHADVSIDIRVLDRHSCPERAATTGAEGRMPAVLGIPAGVKMYSPVFAVSPAAAGALAAEWVTQGGLPTEEREVLDIDEPAMRRARVDPVLHGFLRVPMRRGRTQARKAPTPATEAAAVEAAARGVIARMRPGIRYLLGPGGTTAEVARQLDLASTPLGVDVVLDGAVVAAGASEQELLAEIAEGPAQAIITVIGGQGFLLGRGNQQLSASVLRALGDDPLIVVAPEQKIIDLHGRPLLVDTGDAELDAQLAGHVRITTGVGTSSLYAVASSHTL